MTISKRLRFEIFRRDNHACRYCGGAAPDVQLTVDHVVPVALGGTDEPSNLVTACRDCNSGKSSMPADTKIVEDVASDAIKWAKAMEIVAQARADARAEAERRYDHFLAHWNNWTYTYMGQQKTVPLPTQWKRSLDQFLAAGLDMEDIEELIEVTMTAKTKSEWKYFCGCCWRRISDAQEHARSIMETESDG